MLCKNVPRGLKIRAHADWQSAIRFDNTRESVLFWLMRHKIIANRSLTSTMSDSDRSRRAMAMWALPELEPTAKKQAIPTPSFISTEKNAL